MFFCMFQVLLPLGSFSMDYWGLLDVPIRPRKFSKSLSAADCFEIFEISSWVLSDFANGSIFSVCLRFRSEQPISYTVLSFIYHQNDRISRLFWCSAGSFYPDCHYAVRRVSGSNFTCSQLWLEWSQRSLMVSLRWCLQLFCLSFIVLEGTLLHETTSEGTPL